MVGVDGDVAWPELSAAEHNYHFGSLLLDQNAEGTAALAAQTDAGGGSGRGERGETGSDGHLRSILFA
jgi:hypothetical protein